MTPKEHKQMMEYLLRDNRKKKPETIRTPYEVPQTQLKPLIDLEKELAKYDDNFVESRGKQTEALINTTNKHINNQIKKGNIKKEDMLLKEDDNGLMVNKNRTIAIRDSFVAKQFNKALGVNNEPGATPEQFGKLAERLERNRQMQGKATNVKKFKTQFQKKKAAVIPSTPIKLDTTLPPSFLDHHPQIHEQKHLVEKLWKMQDVIGKRKREWQTLVSQDLLGEL